MAALTPAISMAADPGRRSVFDVAVVGLLAAVQEALPI